MIIEKWLKSTYRKKDCDFSVTDLTRPTYQLWVKLQSGESVKSDTVSFKSFLGSALHGAIETQDEEGVVKEFSWIKTTADGTRIGGTCDELRWRYTINKWRLGDIKLKGTYVSKKFLEGGEEQKKEVLQLSIYRWLFEGLFDIEDRAVIYLFVQGHTAREKMPEYQEVWLDLLPIHIVKDYIQGKLTVAKSPTPPPVDCDTGWLCNYCEVANVCPAQKNKKIEASNKLAEGFGNES